MLAVVFVVELAPERRPMARLTLLSVAIAIAIAPLSRRLSKGRLRPLPVLVVEIDRRLPSSQAASLPPAPAPVPAPVLEPEDGRSWALP